MSSNKLDQIIFKDKTFSNLLEDIYNSSKKKDSAIEKLIKELSEQITDPGTAVIITPLIANYLESSIKNTDNLVKMAGVIQRFLNSNTSKDDGDGMFITETERAQLMKDIKELTNHVSELDDK